MKPDASAPPLRSVHTADFPDLLAHLGASLLVTTYQAGKLVIVRADGSTLNTHFRGFNRPMGLALAGDRLAVGVALEVWEYQNVPSAGRRLEPAGRHDACFLPRAASVTGDVQIHEMAWAGDDLWFVNTRFSCLCTRSTAHSFTPRWRPAFISALAPEDRCHLNGLGLRDGRPRYVTAPGRGDAPASWRADKRDGGVLVDVPANEIIAGGLSMPHSPRWHASRLWVLESGTGRVGVVDPVAGRFETAAQLPGFTRGLDFCGPFAFVGLSQVRESAFFGGVPLTEGAGERACGVWVLHAETGQHRGLFAIRGRRPGGLRRAGPARHPLPGPDQRRPRLAGRYLRVARRDARRRAALVPVARPRAVLRSFPMALPRWLDGLRKRLALTDGRRRRVRSVRPRLEELESRLAPAAFTVNTLADSPNGNGSGFVGDLRDCVSQANFFGGANTIQFDASLGAGPWTCSSSPTRRSARPPARPPWSSAAT